MFEATTMPAAFFIPVRKNKIHVYQYGNGHHLIIAFHGFGESGKSFARFEPLLGPGMTLYAPDLPLHGATAWKEKHMDVPDLEQMIRLLLERAGATSFSLIGYSMGGKIALSSLAAFIGQLRCLILAAPDGLKPNPYYTFVTRNGLGKLLFRYVTAHPAAFQFLLRCGIRFSLMNESIYKFVKQHMQDEKIRKQVFDVWNCLQKLDPDMVKVSALIRQHQLPVEMYFGRYDRIIPPKIGDPYKALPSVQVKITEGGHQLITENVVKEMLSFLKTN